MAEFFPAIAVIFYFAALVLVYAAVSHVSFRRSAVLKIEQQDWEIFRTRLEVPPLQPHSPGAGDAVGGDRIEDGASGLGLGILAEREAVALMEAPPEVNGGHATRIRLV